MRNLKKKNNTKNKRSAFYNRFHNKMIWVQREIRKLTRLNKTKKGMRLPSRLSFFQGVKETDSIHSKFLRSFFISASDEISKYFHPSSDAIQESIFDSLFVRTFSHSYIL
jgi:hypothetical protein